MAIEKRHLGKTGIEISPIGLGCWQFGRMRGPMAFYKTPPQDEINKIVKIALDGGINWFDTAEAYGQGDSERALSKALITLGKVPGDVVIATKWWPTSRVPGLGFPFFPRTARNLAKNIEKRRECLSPCQVDLYQIHRPWSFSSIETQMDVMAQMVKNGQIRSVGVSGFSAVQMRRAHAALAKHGLPLASNQIHFHLVDRNPERNGVLETAKELNVTLIAYSPLGSGLLTGKFHKDAELVKKLPFIRRMAIRRNIEQSRPLIKAMEDISASYKCSVAEVALSWLVNFYGDIVVAIPGATKTEHIVQNVGALNLKLTPVEMAKLDDLSRHLTGN